MTTPDRRPAPADVHHDAVAVVLAALASSAPDTGPTAEDRVAAEEHVADCAVCWDLLSTVYEAMTGDPAPGDAAMRALYGCERVREQLCQLDGVPYERIRREHPGWRHTWHGARNAARTWRCSVTSVKPRRAASSAPPRGGDPGAIPDPQR